MMKKAKFIAFLMVCALGANAQSHMIGVGPSRILDTYISQEKYSGVGITYLYIRAGKKPNKRWQNNIEHEVDLSKTRDRSHTTSMLEGNYNLYWGRVVSLTSLTSRSSMTSRTSRTSISRFHLQAGLAANVNLGFLYDMSTSNNPAQARFALNLIPVGIATYSFDIKEQHFSLRYELDLPLVGLMFSPNYGQSYYEIFSRGNYDHNIVPTTFVSAPNFRQLLTLDWQVSEKWAVRVGYLGNYQQTAVNNLKSHIYTHRFVIGITKTIGEK
jgi:hypothetical protein